MQDDRYKGAKSKSNYARMAARGALSPLLRKAAKKALVWVLKYIVVPLLPFILIGIIIIVIIASTYALFSLGGSDIDMDGNPGGEFDQEAKALYGRYSDAWNIHDTWIMASSGTDLNSFLTTNQLNAEELEYSGIEELERAVAEPEQIDGWENSRYLLDRDHKDLEFATTWATIHAFKLFYQYVYNEEASQELVEEFMRYIHPLYAYRETYRTIWWEETTGAGEEAVTVCRSETVFDGYLVTEADTMHGRYRFEYKWVTEGEGCNKVRYEATESVELIGEQYGKLNSFISNVFNETYSNAELLRVFYLNAETAFSEERVHAQWLLSASDTAPQSPQFIPYTAVESSIRSICVDAGEEYGIRPEILMAIAFAMTNGTLNPVYTDSIQERYGLMGLNDHTILAWGVDANQDGAISYYTPADAVFTAASYLQYLMGTSGIAMPADDENSRDAEQTRKAIYIDALQDYTYSAMGSGASAFAADIYALSYNFAVTNSGRDYAFPLADRSIATVVVTQEYKRWQGGHFGIDIAGVENEDALIATVDGTIAEMEYDYGDAGNYISIQGSDGLRHDYMHLYSFAAGLTVGESVKQGQFIGMLGNTGRSTGPHLHYAVREYPYGSYAVQSLSEGSAHLYSVDPRQIWGWRSTDGKDER